MRRQGRIQIMKRIHLLFHVRDCRKPWQVARFTMTKKRKYYRSLRRWMPWLCILSSPELLVIESNDVSFVPEFENIYFSFRMTNGRRHCSAGCRCVEQHARTHECCCFIAISRLLEEPGELPPVISFHPRGRAIVEAVHTDVLVVVSAEDLRH